MVEMKKLMAAKSAKLDALINARALLTETEVNIEKTK